MGALIRATDWSRTPLGPIERWPQSLRSAVSILLPSKAQIAMFWGEDLITLYNDAYRPVFGAKHPGALGQPIRDAWNELWRAGLKEIFDGVLTTGQAFWAQDMPFFMERHGYLEETYFDVSYDPVRDESGKVGGVFCIVSEVTPRVVGERRLRALRDLGNVAQQERTVRGVYQAAARVLARFGEDVPFALIYARDADRGAAELVAASREVDGRIAPPWLKAGEPWPWPSDLAVLGEADLGRIADLRCGPWPETIREAVVVACGGATSPADACLVLGISPRRRLDEDYLSFLRLIAANIANAMASARKIEDEHQRLQMLAELDRAKTMFFSNVSHEFRTPLTLMLGPLEETLSRPTLAAADREELQVVQRNGLRLLKLVNSLLDFARVEAGRMEATYLPVDMARITADLASLFRSACDQAGLALRVDCPTLRQPVYLDRDMWEKVVLNLLSNAFKFTFQGTIEVRVSEAGGAAQLVVRDTGVGIPAAELPRLFERFHRIEGQRGRTYEGSGIGLALVHELIKLHGGTIEAESEPGAGTTFTVRIPFGADHLPADRLAAGPTPDPPPVRAHAFIEELLRWLPEPAGPDPRVAARGAAPATDPGGAGAPGKDSPRIVLADDNADMRAYVRRLLSPHWQVRTAADGAQAFEAIRAERPDLVIADVMMPRLDGFGLLRKIREDAGLADLPVILLSARAGEEARIEGLERGADDYLVKPFTARELHARVRSQLEMSRARAEILRERISGEEKERKALQHAALLREDFEAVFMQAANPFVILRGPDYVIELANEATCRTWQRTRAEVLDRPLLEVLPELDGQPVQAILDTAFRTGEAQVGTETAVDFALDGQLRRLYFNYVYSPLHGRGGETEGILITAFDVTDTVIARREIDDLRRAAESANRAKDEFLAMLGHELRNPLSPMRTALEIMRLRGAQSREHDILERQVTHLTRLVDDLLDISRITTGKIELRKRPVEVAEALRHALEVMDPLLEKGRHPVELRVASRGMVVEADPERLAQIFSNLLSNAAKYSDEGSPIVIHAKRQDQRIAVEVEDRGIGIDQDMLERIFDLFYQQPQAVNRSRGGLGLGLAIVRNLVEMHHGRITVRSEGAGKGTVVTVELPALSVEAASAERGDQPVLEHSAVRRILVVDDNADAATTLRSALESLGHEVFVAGDGPTAIETARAVKPQIVLLDIGLPVMDGYEVAKELRGMDGLPPDLKLVAITGYGLESDRERSLAAGFAGHLVKPVELAVLAELCR